MLPSLELEELRGSNSVGTTQSIKTIKKKCLSIQEWNKELELSAQRWANQCVKHSVPDIKDTCRDLG